MINNNQVQRFDRYWVQETRKEAFMIKRAADSEKPPKTLIVKSARSKGIIYLPPIKLLKERFRDLNEKPLSYTEKTYLSLIGLVHSNSHRRSIPAGREYLEQNGIEIKPAAIRNDGKISPVSIKVSESEVFELLEKAYPRDKVTDFMNEEPFAQLMSLKEFSHAYPRVYHAMHRSKKLKNGASNGFRKHMEIYWPGLYDKISLQVNPDNIDRGKLKENLLYLFFTGSSLVKSNLLRSEDPQERRIGRQVSALQKTGRVDRDLFSKNTPLSFYETIIDVTGLSKEEVSLISTGRHDCAEIAELLTEFFFIWAFPSGFSMPKKIKNIILPGEVYTHGKNVCFYRKGKYGLNRADIRIGNTAIDSKTGTVELSKNIVDKIIWHYKPDGNGLWADGNPIKSSLIFFNMENIFYKKYKERLSANGINFVGYSEFNYWLKDLVSHLKRNYSESIHQVEPRVNDLEYIADLHNQISKSSSLSLLARPDNAYLREWSASLLNGLNSRGYQEYAEH